MFFLSSKYNKFFIPQKYWGRTLKISGIQVSGVS